jgi:hypothetical protein
VSGSVCNGRSCLRPACGPGNCAGCCQAGMCTDGHSAFACGANGQTCLDCQKGGGNCYWSARTPPLAQCVYTLQ